MQNGAIFGLCGVDVLKIYTCIFISRDLPYTENIMNLA